MRSFFVERGWRCGRALERGGAALFCPKKSIRSPPARLHWLSVTSVGCRLGVRGQPDRDKSGGHDQEARSGSTVRLTVLRKAAPIPLSIVGICYVVIAKRERCVTGEVADPNIRSRSLRRSSFNAIARQCHEKRICKFLSAFRAVLALAALPSFRHLPLAAQSTFPLCQCQTRAPDHSEPTFTSPISARR